MYTMQQRVHYSTTSCISQDIFHLPFSLLVRSHTMGVGGSVFIYGYPAIFFDAKNRNVKVLFHEFRYLLCVPTLVPRFRLEFRELRIFYQFSFRRMFKTSISIPTMADFKSMGLTEMG